MGFLRPRVQTNGAATAPAQLLLPAALIAVGLFVAGYAVVIRSHTRAVSRVSEIGMKANEPEKITTTEEVPSDALIGGLFGLAALLMLAGAFHQRVTKINLPLGGGLELGSDEERAQIARRVAEVVPEVVAESGAQPTTPEETTRVAAKTATAAALAQQRAASLRSIAVQAEPDIAEIAVGGEELRRVRQGMPLSPALVDRLAERAVRDVFAVDDN